MPKPENLAPPVVAYGPIRILNNNLSSSQVCLNDTKTTTRDDCSLQISKHYINDLKRKSQPDLMATMGLIPVNLSTSMFNIASADSTQNLGDLDGFDMKKFSIINKSQLNGRTLTLVLKRKHTD